VTVTDKKPNVSKIKLLEPKDVGWTEEDVQECMRSMTFDSVMETFCRVCGEYCRVEPDATTVYCDCCDSVTPCYNPFAGILF